MRYIIVTGGPLKEEAAGLIKELSGPDEDAVIIACDGGCDFLARHDIVPDMAVGDMDSITAEGLAFIESHNVSPRDIRLKRTGQIPRSLSRRQGRERYFLSVRSPEDSITRSQISSLC